MLALTTHEMRSEFYIQLLNGDARSKNANSWTKQQLTRGHRPRIYPNVTTLRSGICYRKSVCRLSVMFVRPAQGVKAFGDISSPLCTVAIL